MKPKLSNISVRLTEADQLQLKSISQRMGVNTSDLIRYAVKTITAQLYALNRHGIYGKNLLPLFIKYCTELNRYFDLDTDKLNHIFHGELIEMNNKVQMEDLELLTLCGMPEDFASERIRQITGTNIKINNPNQFIKQYLIKKYLSNQHNEELA